MPIDELRDSSAILPTRVFKSLTAVEAEIGMGAPFPWNDLRTPIRIGLVVRPNLALIRNVVLKKLLIVLFVVCPMGTVFASSGPQWRVSSAGATYISKPRLQGRVIHPLWSELLHREPLASIEASAESVRMDLVGYQMLSPTKANIIVQIYDSEADQFSRLNLPSVDLSVAQAKEGFSSLGRRAQLPFALALDARSFVGRGMPTFAATAKTVKAFGPKTPTELVSEAGTVDHLLGFQLVSLQLNEFSELEVKGDAIYGPPDSEFPVGVLQLSKVRKTLNRIPVSSPEELAQALRFMKMPNLTEQIVQSVRLIAGPVRETIVCEGIL